jgi:thiamine monophosphate synthase
MSEQAVHVISAVRGGWSVFRARAKRSTKKFRDKSAAVRFAEAIAQRERVDLFVHRNDGTVENHARFGSTHERALAG